MRHIKLYENFQNINEGVSLSKEYLPDHLKKDLEKCR